MSKYIFTKLVQKPQYLNVALHLTTKTLSQTLYSSSPIVNTERAILVTGKLMSELNKVYLRHGSDSD